MFTRYTDVRALLSDNERLSADRLRPFLQHMENKAQAQNLKEDVQKFQALKRTFASWVVFNDPPDHTRLRRLMDKAFRKRVIEGLRDKIENASRELLDEAVEKSKSTRKMELIRDYANPLPARVIADLLGIPHADMPKLVEWSNGIAAFVLVSRNDKDKYTNAAEALIKLRKYFIDVIEAKRAEMAQRNNNDEEQENDVLQGMIKASDAGDKLTVDELIATCILLIFAGHETTTHLIANGTYALSKFPRQREKLVAGIDDDALIKNAVDEILRFDGPSLANIRVASKDFTMEGGHQIKKKDRLFLFSCAANRDETQFAEPDEFDVTRENAKKHLTFGFGKHFCIGAPLAKLEGEIALRHLLEKFKNLELDISAADMVPVPPRVAGSNEQVAPPFVDLIVTRGLKMLPVRYELR